MRTHAIAPTGKAQSLDVTETFFSTTDQRGVITAGNAVFSRTSGYSLEEMLGQPHNLIRHPGMPRLVFRRLWETIRGGNSFMGYVKNQARNGNHYWVFAVVVPIPTGYLSVRIKPTSPRLGQIESLYGRLAAAESDAIARGATESQAADAARDLLAAELKALGFASYDEFSHEALNTEIKSRDAEIERRSLRLFPAAVAGDGTSNLQHLLDVLYRQTTTVYADLNSLFASLDGFIAACRGIQDRKDNVQKIAEDFRLNALNAQIAAQPLGAEGHTLGTVAQILNRHGQSLSANVTGLADGILHTTSAVADIASNLSAARIQVEMLLTYIAEIATSKHSRADVRQLRAITQDLGVGFVSTIERAFRAVETLRRYLPQVLATKELLRKDVVFLQVAQISGLTEVSRLSDARGLHTTFTGLRGQIKTAGGELEGLDHVVDRLRALTANTPHQVQTIERSILHLRETLTLAHSRTRALEQDPFAEETPAAPSPVAKNSTPADRRMTPPTSPPAPDRPALVGAWAGSDLSSPPSGGRSRW